MNFLNFFIPDFNEPLQMLFSCGISFLLSVTLLCLKLNANPKNWEKNWNGSFEPTNALLSSEQGTLHDIGEVVATRSEKASDVMPGFLLIIGLLGTFLGLGIALNQASEIISNDLSGQNYDEMMNSLMQMMSGLGTKFKASIWGISGFILLRVFSGLFDTENARLNWCASKIKEDNAEKAEQRVKGEFLRLDRTLDASEKLGETISLALNSGFEKQSQMMQKSYELFYQISVQNNEVKDEISKVNTFLSESLDELIRANKLSRSSYNELIRFNKSMESVIVSLNENNSDNKSINDITNRVEKNLVDMLIELSEIKVSNNVTKECVKTNGYDTTQLLENIDKKIADVSAINRDSLAKVQTNVVGVLEGVERCIDTTGRESSQLLEKIIQSIDSSRIDTQENLVGIREDFASVASATKESSSQMKEFSQSTKSSLTTLGKSSERMHEASVGIESGARKLASTVGIFETNMNKVMDKVSQGLDGTITKMSTTFTNSMSGMAKDMSRSTGDISKAVKDNAKSVEVTMDTVKSSISESLKIQQKSSNEFQLSSQTLNETMEEVTTLVNDLTESIQSGLSAVSRSGKEVKSLNSAYKFISDTVIESAGINDSIRSDINQICSEIRSSNHGVSELKSSLDKSSNQTTEKISELIKLLRQDNYNNSTLNELRQVTQILSSHYAFIQKESEKQPARMSEALTSLSPWGKISTDITANNKELKALNRSLLDISDKVTELSSVKNNINVAAL